jgi:ribosomal protein L16 Arg81 hydroxylase
MSIVGQVERIKNITVEEFQGRYRDSKPVVLEGVAKEWQARSVMTPANIRNMFGSVVVNVRETDNELDMFFSDDAFGASRRKYMQIKDYIDLICEKNSFEVRPPYLANVDFDLPQGRQYLHQLKALLSFPNFFRDNSTGASVCLWIAAPGQKSTVHNDNYHNLNAQLYGTKSYLLYSPDQHDVLYTQKINDTCWASRVDPQQSDLEKYPRFKEAKALEAVLNEGDMLYIPIFWFHQAFARTVSISTNMFINVGLTKFWSEEQLNWRRPQAMSAN